MPDSKPFCAIIMLVLFIISIVLFAVSFDTLTPHQVGIKYNNVVKTIDEENIYNNGRYFLGLGLSFLEFPISAELIDFRGAQALRMWSQEGQLVKVDMSMMYRLERSNIIKLYKRYELDYAQRMKQIAIRVAKKVSIQYTAEEFFKTRNLISTHMQSELRRRFKLEFITLELFNLRAIDIPTKFENKVVEKQIWEQKYKTREFEKETAIRRAEITIIQQVTAAKVDRLIAEANALRTQKVELARAEALKKIAEQEARSYSLVQANLGIDGKGLLQYRYSQLMEKLQDPSLNRKLNFVIGLKNALLNIKAS